MRARNAKAMDENFLIQIRDITEQFFFINNKFIAEDTLDFNTFAVYCLCSRLNVYIF